MRVSYGPQPHLKLGGEPVQSVILHRTSLRMWIEVNGLVIGKGVSMDKSKTVTFRNLLSKLEFDVLDSNNKPTGVKLLAFPYEMSYYKGVLTIDNVKVESCDKVDRSQSGVHLRNLLNKAHRQPTSVKTTMWRSIANHLFDYYLLDNYHFYHHPACSDCPREQSTRMMY